MPLNCKAKGSRAEHKSMRLLESLGYRVTRAAASLGAWDLIGISKHDFCVVQVKCNTFPGSVEMETLKLFDVPANCRKLIHRWRDRQRLPDVKEVE